MGKPEKEDKKEKEKEPEPVEILSDIDDYQQKMESQWQSARSNYQNKIDHILEDFLEQSKNAIPNIPEDPKEKNVDSLFSQADKALRAIEKKARDLTGRKSDRARIINIDWAVDRTARPKRGLYMALSGLAVAASIAYYFTSVPKISALPYAHTAGVVVENNRIYIADWFRRALYVHSASRGLPIERIEALPNDFLTGMALSKEKMWTANGVTAQILEHSRTDDHPVSFRADSPGKSPAGLYFDGTDLWSLDNASKRIVRHRGNDIEEIKEEYKLPELDYSGLSMNGNRAWVLSKKSREIYSFRLGDPVKQTGSYDLDSFLKGATPTGIFVEGSRIYLTTENPPQLLNLSKRKVMSSLSASN